MNWFSLIIIFLPNCYCRFQFHLQNRENEVFKNVSTWALNSKGVKYLGEFGNYLICEDTTLIATFAHIRKCFNNCSDASSYNMIYFTGVYGTGSKHFSLNLRQKQCQSKTKSRTFKSLVHNLIAVRRVTRAKLHSFQAIEIDEPPKLKTKRATKIIKWSRLVVKLLIVIDYALYSLLHKDFEYIAQYMNIFWSAVDLKYRNISHPIISIKIVGIIIAEEKNVLDYIDDNQFLFLKKNTLDMYESLGNFLNIKEHFKNIHILEYHAVVTISGLQGFFDEDVTYGMAYKKGLCTHHKNAAIVIDDGQYLGIYNAVHELGHLLGLEHDGVDEIIEGEFNYYNCTNYSSDEFGKNYVMNKKNKLNHDELLWSNCSLRYFNLLESDENVSCAGISNAEL